MSIPSDNPYYQPYQEPTGTAKSGETPGKVKAAAIALIVCGVIDALWGVVRIGSGVLMLAGGNQAQPEVPPDAPPWLRQMIEQANNSNRDLGVCCTFERGR